MHLLSRSLSSRGAFAALAWLLLTPWCAGSALASNHEARLTWAVHITLAARWLDPGETEAAITPFLVLYALHDALVKPMPGGVMTPSLAESWTASSDGRTYDFLLRPNLRFHNGDPLTAEDVKFSFERYKGGSAGLLKERVREVQVVDARRVRFILKEPWPDFMTFYGTTATGAGWVVPKKLIQSVGEEAYKKNPVGAGPYRFVSFTPGVELVMEAYDGYWRKAPPVKRLVLKSMPEETTRAAALKKGEVDLAYGFTGSVAEEMKRTPGLKLVPVRTNTVFFLDFVEQWDPKSPWADQRVRLAASLAVDRAAINQAEFLGFGGLTGTVVPRAMEFAAPIEAHKHDPKRARELLAEAGHPNGFDAGELAAAPPYTTAGEAIVNDLAKVGIRMRLRSMERAAYLSAWREKKLKGVVLGGLGAGGNAATRLEALVTKGGMYAYGVIPEVDDLFQRQAREADKKKREAMLVQIQRILFDRVIFAPIWENALLRASGPRVEEGGLTLIPAYPYSAPYEDLRLKR